MIYPCYFDVKRSRRLGRRVPKSLAVQKPALDELKVIADVLKLVYEIDEEARHPAAWWDDNTGRLIVGQLDQADQKIEKAKIIPKFAKYLIAVKKKKKEKEEQKEKQTHYQKTQQSHKKYQKPSGKKPGRKS